MWSAFKYINVRHPPTYVRIYAGEERERKISKSTESQIQIEIEADRSTETLIDRSIMIDTLIKRERD